MVLESVKNEIQFALERTGLKIHIDIVSIPEEDWGTADTLRHLEETKRIKVSNIWINLISLYSIINYNLF